MIIFPAIDLYEGKAVRLLKGNYDKMTVYSDKPAEKRLNSRGAGEVVVNSIDTDGVKNGFDIEMLSAVQNAVNVPVVASGGAGKAEDFVELFNSIPKMSAGLAASIFHFGEVKITDLKKKLADNGITVRI